jgi:hypothetical protein
MQLVSKQVHDDQIKSNWKEKVRPRREKTPVRNMVRKEGQIQTQTKLNWIQSINEWRWNKRREESKCVKKKICGKIKKKT